MAQRSIDQQAIEAEIDRIRSLGLDALRPRWRTMFGAMPPVALTKELIARMMAYRMQEQAFGGLDRATPWFTPFDFGQRPRAITVAPAFSASQAFP